MIRFPGHRLLVLLSALALALIARAPSAARAEGSWTTYIRMQTCNDVLAMRDTVWLATGEAGLLRYLRSSDTFEQLVRQPSGLASNSVTALAIDGAGRLWAGTSGKGASRLSADLSSWDLANAFDGLPSDSVTVLRADGDTVWIGTTRGIALWNGHLVAGSVPDIGTPSPFRSNNVTGILVMGDSLLVSTSDGIYVARLSQSLEPWASADSGISNKNVLDLARGGSDALALSSGVVYRLNRATGVWSAASTASSVKRLSDDFGTAMCISVDSLCTWNGTRWTALKNAPVAEATTRGGVVFGTAPDAKHFAVRGGTLRVEGTSSWTSITPPGPVGNDVNNILADGSQVWVATNAHGMSRWTSAGWQNWTGGCCGPAQTTSFMEPLYAFALQMDRGGHVWTSHWDTGIERIDTRANPMTFMHAFSAYGLPKSDTLSRHTDGWSSAVDSMGYVYIGMDTPSLGQYDPIGVDIYDSTGAYVINWRATQTNGMRASQIRAVAIDRVNRLVWLGLAGKGLVYTPIDSLDGDRTAPGNDHRRLPTFSLVASTQSVNVFGVVAHGDSIWVLTDSDLKRVRGSDRLVKSTLETMAQPAPVGSVHPLDVAADGTVWTASVDGVRSFPPGGGHTDFTVENSPLADNEVRALSVEPRTGVVWFGTANGVSRYDPHWTAPEPPKPPTLNIKVWPNPSYANNMGISLVLGGNATSYSGEILDITGRVVRTFTAAGSQPVVWDGRDKDGGLVRSGVYFVRAHSGGRDATARIVVLR